jgi:hypothetical protein
MAATNMSEDHDDDGGVNMLISFEQSFTMIRVIENHFLSSTFNIKAEVLGVDDSSEQDFEVAFAKVRFWLENIASRCIAFSRRNDAALKILISDDGKNNTDNLLWLSPEEPTDETIAVLLQAKMTALAEGKLIFGCIEVKSNNINGLRFTFVGNCNEILPSMEEWVGTYNYFDKPWWHRDDASTLDVVVDETADLSKKPTWAYKLDFISKAFKPARETVFRPEFKPTIIDGGKKDD